MVIVMLSTSGKLQLNHSPKPMQIIMEKNKETSAKKTVTRGQFIKNAALATAGFYIVPRHVLGGKGFVAPSDKLYIAAVGCGGEAENDIHHYATTPKKNAVIAYLCDVDERMAA